MHPRDNSREQWTKRGENLQPVMPEQKWLHQDFK
jgi:hypothetical protein